MPTFSTPRGTQDILPDDWPYWDFVLRHAEELARLYDYRRIETPTIADTELFVRTSGEGTDIVEKEMYTFEDKSGDWLTLRPEGTAPVMRAYLQHGMSTRPQPVKLFYVEHMFRREKPQRGRFREHHQFGCEAIGVEDAYIDVEMIALLNQFYNRVGLKNIEVVINSIGDAACRPRYVSDLVTYLKRHESSLASRDLERLERNPLRVLDTKERESRPVVDGAPSILNYLCPQCSAHWEKLQRGLDAVGIPYRIDPHLVRGLDYYTRTVFEFMSAEEGAAATINAGGRYDALAELLGGPHTPGIGFGLGIERVVLLMQARGIEVEATSGPAVYLAHLGAEAESLALQLAGELRRAGVAAAMGYGTRSLKAQMKAANTSGAEYTVLIGEDEIKSGTASLRNLRTGVQTSVPADRVADEVRGATAASSVSS